LHGRTSARRLHALSSAPRPTSSAMRSSVWSPTSRLRANRPKHGSSPEGRRVDKDLRSALRGVVIACRHVLEEDVRRQLEGTYGGTPGGEFIAREDVEPYAVAPREWRGERDEILAAIAHIESYGADRAHAVEQFVRESAFTILNRLAALKLMEQSNRGLIPES